MRPLKRHKGINSAEDFEDYACQALDDFLEDLSFGDHSKGYTRDVNDGDSFAEDFTYFFTQSGMAMIDRFIRRMKKVAKAHFPDTYDDISIKSFYCREP